jgi:hypothetical protein
MLWVTSAASAATEFPTVPGLVERCASVFSKPSAIFLLSGAGLWDGRYNLVNFGKLCMFVDLIMMMMMLDM